MGNQAVKTARRCVQRLRPWPSHKNEAEGAPCTEPFPDGLGPLSVRIAPNLVAETVVVAGFGPHADGRVYVARSTFSLSEALVALRARLDDAGVWKPLPTNPKEQALELIMSPPHAVNLPPAMRERLGIARNQEVHWAWVYPAALDWVATASPGSPAGEEGSTSPSENQEEVVMPVDANTEVCPKCPELDTDDADVSFLTVGGYMYFRSRQHQSNVQDGQVSMLTLLSACAIRYSPAGALKFSAPRRWEEQWTVRLRDQGRFQPITAQKWAAAGARYVCWVRPDELLPDQKGRKKAVAHLGGFAFLFHDIMESDTHGLDRYFEIVSSPDIGDSTELASPCMSPSQRVLLRGNSLPYSLVAAPHGHEDRLLSKLHTLARARRWPLVRHLLAEYRHLAAAKLGDRGTTLLHICAEGNVLDADLLAYLRDLGVPHDPQDLNGRTPEELGNQSFGALLRSVWGISPDLFTDPNGWFEFWAASASSSVIGAQDLAHALASSYRCNAVGTQWLSSFVNINYPAGVSKSDFFRDNGFFQTLQASEEFAGLRQQRTPPLFRSGVKPLSDSDKRHLLQFEERLEQMRLEHGYQPGRGWRSSTMLLQMPAPCAEGSVDNRRRLEEARQMLSFSFEQTRCLTGRQWQLGFRVNFAGQEGLDEGGLTKAWVAEMSYALWADDAFFDTWSSGMFFKPDAVDTMLLAGAPVKSLDLYRWVGRFIAYSLYQRCLADCRLCPWVFRALHRSAQPRQLPGRKFLDWPNSPEGEDLMLEDLASLDHEVASSLWRVRHEMDEEELQWLDFTCSGVELEPGGADRTVNKDNRASYIRQSCDCLLHQRCLLGLKAFVDGFLEVVPARLLEGVPPDGTLQLLAGSREVTDAQLDELQRVVIPAGLVPTRLRDHPKVKEAARWLFRAIRQGDGSFRSRLLEFWIGVGRVPLSGLGAVRPPPRLQIMVQEDGRGGVKRIASWPAERLPEGHTCGNELWIALPTSYEAAAAQLRLAIGNFEAGFAMR